MKNPIYQSGRAVADRSACLYLFQVLKALLEKRPNGTVEFRDVINSLEDSINIRLGGLLLSQKAIEQVDAEADALLWSEDDLENASEKEALWAWFTASLLKQYDFGNISGLWETILQVTILPTDLILAHGSIEMEQGTIVFKPMFSSNLFNIWMKSVLDEELSKRTDDCKVFLLGYENESGYRMYFY